MRAPKRPQLGSVTGTIARCDRWEEGLGYCVILQALRDWSDCRHRLEQLGVEPEGLDHPRQVMGQYKSQVTFTTVGNLRQALTPQGKRAAKILDACATLLELEVFFESPWCTVLGGGVDPESIRYLLKRVNNQSNHTLEGGKTP